MRHQCLPSAASPVRLGLFVTCVASPNAAWRREKKAHTLLSLLARGGALASVYSELVDTASGDAILKRPTCFTPVSLLRNLKLIPLLGSMLTFHHLHRVPFLFFKTQENVSSWSPKAFRQSACSAERPQPADLVKYWPLLAFCDFDTLLNCFDLQFPHL